MGLLRRAKKAIGKAVQRQKLYSAREYSKLTGVPESFVRAQIKSGKIPTERFHGNKLILKSTGRIVRHRFERAYAKKLNVTVKELRKEIRPQPKPKSKAKKKGAEFMPPGLFGW